MNDFFSLVNVKESINIVALFTFTKKVLNGKLYFFVQCIALRCQCPSGDYLFKVNNRNTRKRCETCPKLTMKTSERCSVVLVSLLLTLNIFHNLF